MRTKLHVRYRLITPIINVTYLGNCLFKKFNTLCKPNVYVDGVSILDHSTGLSYVYRTDEPDAEIEILPDSKEWPGKFSIYDTPWWERDSISAYDYSCNSQEELDNIKFWLTKIVEQARVVSKKQVVIKKDKTPPPPKKKSSSSSQDENQVDDDIDFDDFSQFKGGVKNNENKT